MFGQTDSESAVKHAEMFRTHRTKNESSKIVKLFMQFVVAVFAKHHYVSFVGLPWLFLGIVEKMMDVQLLVGLATAFAGIAALFPHHPSKRLPFCAPKQRGIGILASDEL